MTNSMHHNLYSQRGCTTCKQCTGGAGNVGRATVLVTLALFTCGLSLLILPFYRKCVFCGHNSWMDKHAAPGQN